MFGRLHKELARLALCRKVGLACIAGNASEARFRLCNLASPSRGQVARFAHLPGIDLIDATQCYLLPPATERPSMTTYSSVRPRFHVSCCLWYPRLVSPSTTVVSPVWTPGSLLHGWRRHRAPAWSVPSSEVTKCDTNTSPRRLATHLLQQVDQSFTSRRHSGHGSASATRNNIIAKDQTTIAKASKASSEYHTMEALCGGPRYTCTVGCRAATYSTSSGTKSGLSYGPPWAHYLGGYQDWLLGGPLGLPDLRCTAPDGVKHKDYGGEVLG
jgi:hypothetical protein